MALHAEVEITTAVTAECDIDDMVEVVTEQYVNYYFDGLMVY